MMELQVWKRRCVELMREAQQDRLAKALRDTRKLRGGTGEASSLASSLVWEIKRIAGRLRKRR